MRSAALVIACLVVACTRPAAKCPTPPPAATAPEVPPEDAQLTKWKAIAALPNKVPEGGMTPALLVEVVEYLGSPDPVRRDGIGYEVLAKWIDTKVLDDEKLRAVTEQLLAYLASPIEETGSGVFRRSFSALVLGEVVRRDRKSPFLAPEGRRAILTAAHAYAARETDLRGHTGATGWAHAAAHTADLLVRLAQLEGFTDADRATILDAVAELVARRHGTILAHGEDSRLALSVVAAARGGLTAEAIDAWLGKLAAPLGEKPAANPFEPKLYAAQRNVRNLLFTLHVHGSTTQATTPGEILLFDKVRALLAE